MQIEALKCFTTKAVSWHHSVSFDGPPQQVPPCNRHLSEFILGQSLTDVNFSLMTIVRSWNQLCTINEGITDKEYEHAKNVWRMFGMKTMRDYRDLYLRSDVLLLNDVFESFRVSCMWITTNATRPGTTRRQVSHGTLC